MAGSDALLEVEDLVVTFGGVRAVDGADLAVEEGEILGLIGPNGAGKTTTLDAVTGFVPHRGRVRLAGADLGGLPPHRRVRAGLARTWQSLELFDDLTVRENCEVGLGRGADLPAADAALAALAAVGLEGWAERAPSDLPLGLRKLVAVARAMVTRPRVLLLDEPAAGLDSDESLALGRRLRDVADGGCTLVLVDHDMGLVLGLCDRVAVLEYGRVVVCDTPAAVRRDPRVVEAYLGQHHDGEVPA